MFKLIHITQTTAGELYIDLLAEVKKHLWNGFLYFLTFNHLWNGGYCTKMAHI